MEWDFSVADLHNKIPLDFNPWLRKTDLSQMGTSFSRHLLEPEFQRNSHHLRCKIQLIIFRLLRYTTLWIIFLVTMDYLQLRYTSNNHVEIRSFNNITTHNVLFHSPEEDGECFITPLRITRGFKDHFRTSHKVNNNILKVNLKVLKSTEILILQLRDLLIHSIKVPGQETPVLDLVQIEEEAEESHVEVALRI